MPQVISCGDVMNLGSEARAVLHNVAQKRAQKAVEEFMEKKLTLPYTQLLDPEKGTATSTAALVELYWCHSDNMPLHSAYYNLYTSDKMFFDKKYLRVN